MSDVTDEAARPESDDRECAEAIHRFILDDLAKRIASTDFDPQPHGLIGVANDEC